MTSQTLSINTHLLTTHPSPTNLNYQGNANYYSNHHIPLSHRMSSPPSTQHVQNMNRHSPVRTKSIDSDPRKTMIVDNYVHDTYYTQYHETDSHSNINYSPIYHPDPEVVSTGLGGYWIKNENNESVWVSTVSPMNTPPHGHWTRDKRFGSLDRRKEKFTKHIERKNTIVTMSPPEIQPTTRNHEIKPLIRTQSLGSVGAQTVDILYQHDDNSSYDSDGQSFKERSSSMYSRKSKPKGWCETSLDTPPPLEKTEETHFQPPSRLSFSSPQTPKLLEIPAESNPSPNVIETPTELFNNNLNDLPKNCTVVQAGQFKPYREVTKPFEMEDFYKYSTKFREKKAMETNEKSHDYDKNREGDNQSESDPPAVQKSIYQPLQPMKCQPYGPPK